MTCTSFFRGGTPDSWPNCAEFVHQPRNRLTASSSGVRPLAEDVYHEVTCRSHLANTLIGEQILHYQPVHVVRLMPSGADSRCSMRSLHRPTRTPNRHRITKCVHGDDLLWPRTKKLQTPATSRNRITPRHAVRVGHAPHTPRIQNASPVDESGEGEDQVTSRDDTRELELLPRKGLPGRESRPNMPVCSRTNQCAQTLEPRTSFLFCTVAFCSSSARKNTAPRCNQK